MERTPDAVHERNHADFSLQPREVRSPTVYRLLALGALSLMPACDGGVGDSPEESILQAAQMAEERFHDHFELVQSIVPEQSAEDPIIRISSVVFDDTHVMIGDVSEANVKVFSRRTGERLAILGGSGQGPEEFGAPRYLLLSEQGVLLVGDAGNSRLSRWDPLTGELLATMPTGLGYLGGLLAVGESTLVAISAELGGRGDVLALLGSDHVVSSTHLPISNVLPRGVDPDHPWANLRVFHGATLGDTVFVTSTISDSLWSFDLGTGHVARQQLVIPGYVSPEEPAARLRSPAELSQWASGFHTAAPMKASGGFIYIPFVQGILAYGDPLLLVVRNPTGSWFALSGSPPLVAAHEDEIVVIGNPMEDPLRLEIYRWRGH